MDALSESLARLGIPQDCSDMVNGLNEDLVFVAFRLDIVMKSLGAARSMIGL